MRKKKKQENQTFRFDSRVISTRPAWHNPVLEVLLYAGITFMAVAGSILSLVSGYRAPVSTELVLVLTAVFSLLFTILYRSPAGNWVFYVSVILLTVVGLYTWEELWAELTVLWNESLHALNPSFALLFTLPQEEPQIESGWPFITLLIFLLCMACGYTVSRNSKFVPLFVMTFPFIELVFLPGLVPNFFALSMAIISYGAVLAISKTVGSGQFHQTGRRKDKEEKARMRPLPRVFAPAVATVSVLMICALMLAQSLLSVTNYTRPEAFDRLRNAALTMDWRSVFYNPDLARGMLSLANNQKFDKKTDLIVTMPLQTDTVYLKGYTGSLYNRGNWEQLNSSAYTGEPFATIEGEGKEFAEVSENFSDAVMLSYGWWQVGLNDTVYRDKNGTLTPVPDRDFDIEKERNAENPRFVAGTTTVEPVRAGRRYAYLPYFSYRSGALSYDLDRYARLNNGELNYSVDYFQYAGMREWLVFDEGRFGVMDMEVREWGREIKFPDNPYELEYREFVKSNYLTVPDGFERLKADAAQVLNDARELALGEASPNLSGISVNFDILKDTLRDYLSAQADYSLTPGAVPAGSDPINYALYENHKGYCMHFASAATLMFRAMGIPARYVEGYVVTGTDFDGATVVESKENEYGVTEICKMELKDSNSHAWTEIYAEGLGWIPVEVTPGYSSAMEVLPTENPGVVKPVPRVSSSASSSSKASSSRPAVSSAASSSRTSSSGGTAGKRNSAIWIVLLILGLCIATVAVLLPRTMMRRLLEKTTSTKSINTNVLALYAFLVKLLEYERFPQAEYVCYAPEKLASWLDFLPQGDCERWMDTVLKARFSGRDVEQAEKEDFGRMVREVQMRLYARKSPAGKFFMKYVRALI